MEILLKGIVMGFCIAAPVGPIGVLRIRRSVTNGRLTGFVSGLGAATADALYGFIAALGLTAVTLFLLEYRGSLQFFGGLFLVYIGYRLVRMPRKLSAAGPVETRTLASAYGSTLALTIANPATILSFIGIFAGLGIGTAATGIAPGALLVTGVFLGSATWWLLLSTGASWLGAKLHPNRLHAVNVISGSIIIAFGAWQTVTPLLAHSL